MANTPLPNESSRDEPKVSQRLDPSHGVAPAKAKQPTAPVAQTATAGGAAGPQPLPLEAFGAVASQATDIAEKLAEQQAELDRRAAEISKKEAAIEAKLRSARIWFDEQHQTLDQRSEELDAREDALDHPEASEQAESEAMLSAEAAAQLAAREAELDARQADLYEQIESVTADRARLAQREARLDERQTELDHQTQEALAARGDLDETRRANVKQAAELEQARAELLSLQEEIDNQTAELTARETKIVARQTEVQAAIKRFEGLGVTEQRIAELSEQAEQFQARARHLDEAEALLTEEKTGVAKLRRELEKQRQEAQQQFLVERRQIETERAEVAGLRTQFEQRRHAQETQLQQRRTALEQLQSELQAGQREVLEMRLATEETWAQLAGALTPATLTRSIAQVRAKLADHYQHTLQEIADRRRDLSDIATQLANEHSRIDEQRAKIELWAGRREEDIEQRAARLIAREQELDRQQRHYEQLEIRWAAERNAFRERIRQLLSESRDEPILKAA